MHVNYGITVGLKIHKNFSNFNWKLPELLQAYLFLQKLIFYRQVGNYYLSSTSDSFIPSTIKMWNSLNNNIRNVDTLLKFKSELKKIDETENHSVPKTFFSVVLGN